MDTRMDRVEKDITELKIDMTSVKKDIESINHKLDILLKKK
jgi:archaellum component FlaC